MHTEADRKYQPSDLHRAKTCSALGVQHNQLQSARRWTLIKLRAKFRNTHWQQTQMQKLISVHWQAGHRF
jgi:hypothetical protein